MPAFRIQPKSNTFKTHVSFKDFDENGRTIRHSIEMEFKRLTRKGLDAALTAHETPKDDDGEPIKLSAEEQLELNADQALQVVTGWNIQGPSGEEFPLTRDNMIAMIDSYPAFLNAIFEAAKANITGELARKN